MNPRDLLTVLLCFSAGFLGGVVGARLAFSFLLGPLAKILDERYARRPDR